MAELAQVVNGHTKAEPSGKNEETSPTPPSWRKRLSQVLDSASLSAIQFQQPQPQHQTGRLGQKLATWQERERQVPEQLFGPKTSLKLNSRTSGYSILSRSRHAPNDGTEKIKAASGSHILPYPIYVGEAERPMSPYTDSRHSSPRIAVERNAAHQQDNGTAGAAPATAVSAGGAAAPENSPGMRSAKSEFPGERARDRYFSFSSASEGEKRRPFASVGRHDHQQPRVPVHPVYARIGLRVHSPNFTVRIGLANIDDGPVCVQADVFTSVGTVLEAMLRSGVLKKLEDDADIDEDTEWGIWVDGFGSAGTHDSGFHTWLHDVYAPPLPVRLVTVGCTPDHIFPLDLTNACAEEGRFLWLTDMPFTPDDPLRDADFQSEVLQSRRLAMSGAGFEVSQGASSKHEHETVPFVRRSLTAALPGSFLPSKFCRKKT
ncbi:MAG: hypothetical protein BJ554DRAFT_7082 [Olpidium bornovanus]|uniref:Uncharacterized protein n=1 Tax=Olpidium bornovanus TaxID=278681 RepID=A0A8H8DJG9_9FUNG|nr:MAG: hypothetical protein BJ554DRAFT_7082 [Olpidium bornovanus]